MSPKHGIVESSPKPTKEWHKIRRIRNQFACPPQATKNIFVQFATTTSQTSGKQPAGKFYEMFWKYPELTKEGGNIFANRTYIWTFPLLLKKLLEFQMFFYELNTKAVAFLFLAGVATASWWNARGKTHVAQPSRTRSSCAVKVKTSNEI